MSRKELMEQDVRTIGHVAHGKSTVVKAISGIQTVRFKNELERNITIKLWYANAKIYKCENEPCPRPFCYKYGDLQSYGSGKEGSPALYVMPLDGHDILMATMLNGAAIMDGALLLIAANESCLQPQTSEHLAALEIMQLNHIIILQNKVDLVQEDVAINQHEAIQTLIKHSVVDGAPIIPISGQLKSGVDDLKGGVAGGSILRGILKVNQTIEVRPGIVNKDESGKIISCTPIYSRIVSLFAEQNELQFAVPGGLIGVGTTMDPMLTRADRLVGQVLGEVGSLPEIYIELKGTESQGNVSKLTKNEDLMLNIGSMSTGAKVLEVKKEEKKYVCRLLLTSPVCTRVDVKVVLSRKIEHHWRLIGWGKVTEGLTVDVVSPLPF
ncbi:hypothetical protein IFM89_008712 [Coptis chinensis]|uniref:protein-synthesizing GTPase n=1 Tax=Coptis chinensis TaxID=261450 RepID=A0A835LBH8_9MAGN|nr:hypothetical protein IFM89_008712 [Coptis chinensis]